MKTVSTAELVQRHKLERGLSGYPIAALLDEFLASTQRPKQQRETILFLLNEWATLLWRDMGELPSTDDDLVREICQRMACSRNALLSLHDAVMEL